MISHGMVWKVTWMYYPYFSSSRRANQSLQEPNFVQSMVGAPFLPGSRGTFTLPNSNAAANGDEGLERFLRGQPAMNDRTGPAITRDEDGQGSGARSVVRALRVLELFTVDHVTLTVAAVAEALDLPRPTAHRLLITLVGRGYVRQEIPGGPYASAPACSRSPKHMKPWSRSLAALPAMHDLLAKTGESVALHIRQSENTRICLHRIESAHPMQIVIPIGQPMPLQQLLSQKVGFPPIP